TKTVPFDRRAPGLRFRVEQDPGIARSPTPTPLLPATIEESAEGVGGRQSATDEQRRRDIAGAGRPPEAAARIAARQVLPRDLPVARAHPAESAEGQAKTGRGGGGRARGGGRGGGPEGCAFYNKAIKIKPAPARQTDDRPRIADPRARRYRQLDGFGIFREDS